MTVIWYALLILLRGQTGFLNTSTKLTVQYSGLLIIPMLLRESEHKGNATYELADSLARGARGPDPHGYRAEFLKLLATASDL